MKRTLLFLILSTLLFSCSNETKQENKEEAKPEANTSETEKKAELHNFVVIWSASTDAENLTKLEDFVQAQKNEFSDLLSKGVVLNAYNNTLTKEDKSILFLMQAASREDAEKIISEMTFVKEKISTYQIFPLGAKWFGESKIEDATKNTYVSIWSKIDGLDKQKYDAIFEDNIQKQTDMIAALYEKGLIENVYFDTKMDMEEGNDIADFVMYVRAEDEKTAKSILADLPFYQNGIVDYKLIHVGFPWMGELVAQ